MSVKVVFKQNGVVMEVEMEAYTYNFTRAKKEGDLKSFTLIGNVKSLKPWVSKKD